MSHERAVGSSNLHDLPHMFGALRALSRVRHLKLLSTCWSPVQAIQELSMKQLCLIFLSVLIVLGCHRSTGLQVCSWSACIPAAPYFSGLWNAIRRPLNGVVASGTSLGAAGMASSTMTLKLLAP